MKKFLSLVLALVMTMSLVTVSAGAKDFTDDSSITYKEAVDVISALGVVDGYSGGDFRPDDVLTRGAAAKIICNLILGPTTASALSAGTAPFKDVPVTNTFAGYITYCSQQGIISGYADGTFRPTGTLSGNAFMKMLLGALGYDSSIEGYTGANWTVSVIKQAVGIGLDDGNDNFVGSKAVTRQEAALYAYNMLQATMVEYDQKNTIVVGDIEINTTSSRKDVANNDKTETIAKDGKMQFAERYFSDLKKVTSDESDEFERPATTWKMKADTIGTYADEPDLTYTAAVEMGDIYKDLDLSSSLKASEVNIYRNGAPDGNNGKWGIGKGDKNEVGGNGVLTEVFYNDDDDTAVITMIDTYLGEVTSTHKASGNRDAYISISPKADGIGVGGNFDTEESFDVDDLVLYTYSNKSGDKGIQTVINASETVTGTLKSFTTGKSVKVGDTTYKGSDVYKDEIADLTGAVDQEVSVYLDQYGYVVYVDTDAVSGNYAVVIGIDTSKVGDRAKLLFADGTVSTVDLKNSGGADEGDIVSYTKNSSNEYKLVRLAQDQRSTVNSTAKENLILNGKAALNNGVFKLANAGSVGGTVTATTANGKTTFLIATSSSNGTEYRVYEGIKNVPDIIVAQDAWIPVATYVEKGSAARVIFVDATKNATVSGSSDDIIFVKGNNSKQSYDSTLGNYWEYDAIINGEFTTIKTTQQVKGFTLFNLVSYDKNGVAISLSDDGNVVVGKGTERVKNDVVGLNDSYYTYTKDCQVFHIDEDGDIDKTVYTVSNIATDDNDNIWFVTDSGDVAAIVYQDVPDDNNTYYTVTFTGFSGNTYIQNVKGENISDVQKVIEGKDFQFKLAPVAGKSVASVKVGSETLTPDSNGVYTVSNVKKDIQIDLTFAETVTLTFKSNDTIQAYIVVNGAEKAMIDNSTTYPVTIAKGSSVTLEIIPASGKTVSNVTAAGNFVSGDNNNYTIVANATGDVVITMA